jgi:hypothetical protein
MTPPTPHTPSPAAAEPTGTPDIAMMRAELRRVQTRLARIDADLAQLQRVEPTPTSRPRAERYYQLLLAIYEHGRHGVDAAQLGILGADYDYDRRGLGGFFAGRRAPLRLTGERVHLTPEGERLLERHLQDHTS